MPDGLAVAAAIPKKHSAFYQVVFRKTGEAFDLGGKALIGLSGLGSLLQGAARVDWVGLGGRACVGGVFLAPGIYLQAKAEET
jgi:hypothetical protein